MKSQKEELGTIRGMRDLVGTDATVFEHIVQCLTKVVKNYGYHRIETPILEYTSVFARTLGETTDVVSKEMFSFNDRSNKHVSLRPEGTASIVRALLTNKLTQTLPQRWFYYGPMFRYDRPQKGRYRQFYQFGIECLGVKSPLADVEAIAAAYAVFQALYISDFQLRINSVGDAASRKQYRAKLVDYFSRYKSELSEDSQRRLTTNPLRILDSKEACDQKIAQNAPSIFNSLTPEALVFFEQVLEGLSALNIPFQQDRLLVRGLDYYDHTTFEITTKLDGKDDSIALVGGGRYNGLVKQMGGPSIPAVGWAFGLDRLMLALTSHIPTPSQIAVLFVSDAEKYPALQLANHLRSKLSIPVLFPTDGDFMKRLKYSNKLGVSCVLIVGEDEVAKRSIKCKFFRAVGAFTSGQEISLAHSDITTLLFPLFNAG